jgi:hypothetical protein
MGRFAGEQCVHFLPMSFAAAIWQKLHITTLGERQSNHCSIVQQQARVTTR